MDTVEARTELDFFFDLSGRVRNMSLPASPANALIPLFEAVSNALHAVEARWRETAADAGEIEILLHRRDEEGDSHIVGFTVRDNGIGLTEANWKSFRTSDSDFKISRGGKGVGRLAWLKAFGDCQVVSRFEADGTLRQRSYSFALRGAGSPIHGHLVTEVKGTGGPGTEIRLLPFHTPYEVHCPKKTATIAAKLVGHFLPYLAIGELPRITLVDTEESVDLRQFYSDNQQRNSLDILSLNLDLLTGPTEFQVHHVLLKKQLKFLETGLHWMFYAGHERVAKSTPIDGQLGLRYIGDDDDCVYVGLVTGPYLDGHVNQERTGFTFGEERADELHKAAVTAAKGFLSSYIGRLREQQIETTGRVIRANPQFLTFRDALPEFVEANLSLSAQGEEEIYLELSRRKLRAKRRLEGQLQSLRTGADSVEGDVQAVTKALNDEKKSSLAEYVVRRKAILDLLDSSLAFKDPAARKHYREEVIHELIVPLRSNSEDLDYDQHNLWILDDRLAFYSFFRSDKPFKTFVTGSDSGREPDLAIVFDQGLAFRREGGDEPVVIVEFKRPGRNDFDGNSNPVTQVLEYVDVFRNGTGLQDKNGRLVKPISPATRFICFVVADFTETLLKVVRTSPANNATADGQGFFGISREHNAIVEVMPYDKVLHDARIRNEAFFKHLGLI
jgi:hypothetical protein